MRITEIEIKNFKAFYGTYRIDLRKSGKNLLIYGENGKQERYKDGTPFLDQNLVNEIELYRNIILNPLSHARIVPVVKKEVSEAIEAVKKLEAKLAAN